MTYATVMCACGHLDVVNVRGGRERRAKRIENYSRECEKCWKVRHRSERAAASAAAGEWAKTMHLPELEGSKKQIAWAETIRRNVFEALERHSSDSIRHATGVRSENAMRKRFDAVRERMMAETSAKVWIDHRNVWAAIGYFEGWRA